jgi:hypothetical protein
MIILEEPYVSEFLLETIVQNSFPVLATPAARVLSRGKVLPWIEEETARLSFQKDPGQRLYTTSENAISWISGNLQTTGLPEKIALFKDKWNFRELIHSLYPDFVYRVLNLENLMELDPNSISFPVVIKPATGFFSIGVYIVHSLEEWVPARDKLIKGFKSTRQLFPHEVLNSSKIIIEQYIPGEEYAIDAFFDDAGKPCVLNILKHLFSSAHDVGDRIYLTSKPIIQKNMEKVLELLTNISRLAELKNFPVHLEIRIDENGNIHPIELNPMRFGGWCTTPDLTYHAYGINPYEAYMHQQKPDWESVLSGMDDSIYSLVVLDNATGVPPSQIKAFNYDKLLGSFERTLELRKIDFHQYPVFGFLFLKTKPENYAEIETILRSNLREFIIPQE